MSSRSLYVYEPLGGHSVKRSWREYTLFPTRCIAILLIVGLSLTCIIFLTFYEEWPWTASLVPKIFSSSDASSSQSGSTPWRIFPPYPASAPAAALVGSTKYHPFVAPSAQQALADPRIQPIRAHAVLSDACLDRWVSAGQWSVPCERAMVAESRIDLVYIWVNGSDALHQQARKSLLEKTKYLAKDARFREHDELRYSLRAARAATRTWPNSTWHIVSADVRDPEPARNPSTSSQTVVVELATAVSEAAEAEYEHGQRRLGLVPQWLDIECAYHGEGGAEGEPPIRMLHDTQLFRLTSAPGTDAKPEEAAEWLQRILPSFNSHAIESQLPQLQDFVSDNVVALNDDQLIALPMPPSAFHTTLYGPVFRVDPNLLVGGDPSGGADGGGEWRSLGWSAHLLNERFGARKRPYIQHNARSLQLSLAHEASLMFGSYFAKTPFSQFRGAHKVPGEYEVNTIFLTTHFVVERHREALLYSWIVLKWDGDREGMWRDLGGREGEDLLEFTSKAERTTAEDVELNLLMAGIAPPRALDDQVQGDTTYTWTSMDGYSPEHNRLLAMTSIQRSQCFNDNEESAWSLFRWLLVTDTDCGDHIISALIHKSKSGLGAFLPPASSSNSKSSSNEPITLPLLLPTTPPPLPSNPRAFAVRLLQRYAHVLGDSPSLFVSLQSYTLPSLKSVDAQPATALLCLNDDLGNSPKGLSQANAKLREWFEGRWGERLRCEV